MSENKSTETAENLSVFILNGNKFKTPIRFYKYVEEIFTYGLSWQTGRNLDAFADILIGGFGKHEAGEKIKVVWMNLNKSRERLPQDFLEAALEILEDAENVVF